MADSARKIAIGMAICAALEHPERGPDGSGMDDMGGLADAEQIRPADGRRIRTPRPRRRRSPGPGHLPCEKGRAHRAQHHGGDLRVMRENDPDERREDCDADAGQGSRLYSTPSGAHRNPVQVGTGSVWPRSRANQASPHRCFHASESACPMTNSPGAVHTGPVNTTAASVNGTAVGARRAGGDGWTGRLGRLRYLPVHLLEPP